MDKGAIPPQYAREYWAWVDAGFTDDEEADDVEPDPEGEYFG